MNRSSKPIFTSRPTTTLELPLGKHIRVLHPEQVILKIGDGYLDIGALCYALHSNAMRKPRQAKGVDTRSLLKQRPKQILQLIKALSNLVTGGGKSLSTTAAHARHFKKFMEWADANGQHDCLAGGEVSRRAFQGWATYIRERYQRQQIKEKRHNDVLTQVSALLEATTSVENLMKGIRKVQRTRNPNSTTEPLALHDFAHAVALNQSLFDGLCDLVLENRPFPYKLELPASLGWTKNHLWLFPTIMWRLPPPLRNDISRAQQQGKSPSPYDYENGRLATVDEIEHRYKGLSRCERRRSAANSIRRAEARLNKANADPQDLWRFTLGMHAQRAFRFLFFCNTGGNIQVVRDLETDGAIDSSVQSQKLRALKWRAGGKEVKLVVPPSFLPRLRRFMELRQYLLQDRKTPYLFFSLGAHHNRHPTQFSAHELELHYKRTLTAIDPRLPKISPRVLRASVDDYYLRYSDKVVAAAVMGHTVETEERNYARGSANDHHEDMTLFMISVAESARRQRVIPVNNLTLGAPPLEQGGRCDNFGHPEVLAAHSPNQPDCRDSQGCLFCNHRVLIAGEEDARKVASVAYVMEQLILGPKHEEALRPSISKCDEDLKKISTFPNCRLMVEKVRKDVYDNENLTPFWADKYQLFMELSVIS